jgi:hypothetical protein
VFLTIGRPTEHPPRAKTRELFPSTNRSNQNNPSRNNGVDLFASRGDRPIRARASSVDSNQRLPSSRNRDNGALGFSIKGKGAGAGSGRLGYGDEDSYGGGDEGGFSFVGASSTGAGRRKGGGDLFGDSTRIRGRASRAA